LGSIGDNLPTVSVIIPAYNSAHWLPDALRSVQDQTYTEWECVVVDDGSTDNTSEVVKGFLEEDGRFKYISKENEGPSRARNVGIESSDGEFVAFLDADDIWLPEKLHCQIDVLAARPEVGLSCCYFEIVDEHLVTVKTWQEVATSSAFPDEIHSEEFIRCFPNNIVTGSASAAVVRRACFQEAGIFDPDLKIGEDWDLWYRISLNSAILQEKRVLVRLRRYPKQQDIDAFLWNRAKLLKKVRRMIPVVQTRSYKKYLRHNAFTEAFDLCLKHRLLLKALRYLGQQTLRAPLRTIGYMRDRVSSFLRNRQ
jgi:glycosyltransferase involved in cell wall biosynthesis